MSVKHNNNKIKYRTYNVKVGLHASTITESYSGPRDTDPYKEYTMHCGIPKAHTIYSECNESQ
jgi:hypothetical protein